MSLRDQLMKKGLVSKKAAAKADRKAKQNRKKQQGNKQRKHILEAEKAAAAKAKAENEKAAREAKQRERRARQDAYTRALQIRNLLVGHRLENRGDVPFYFRKRDGQHIGCMKVHRRIAEELSKGSIGIAWLDEGLRDTYILLGGKGVRRLQELEADHVLMHAVEPSPRGPDEQLLLKDWDVSLRPHRLR